MSEIKRLQVLAGILKEEEDNEWSVEAPPEWNKDNGEIFFNRLRYEAYYYYSEFGFLKGSDEDILNFLKGYFDNYEEAFNVLKENNFYCEQDTGAQARGKLNTLISYDDLSDSLKQELDEYDLLNPSQKRTYYTEGIFKKIEDEFFDIYGPYDLAAREEDNGDVKTTLIFDSQFYIEYDSQRDLHDDLDDYNLELNNDDVESHNDGGNIFLP